MSCSKQDNEQNGGTFVLAKKASNLLNNCKAGIIKIPKNKKSVLVIFTNTGRLRTDPTCPLARLHDPQPLYKQAMLESKFSCTSPQHSFSMGCIGGK